MSRGDRLPGGVVERLYSPPEIGAPGKRLARARRRDLVVAGLFVLIMTLIAASALYLLLRGPYGRAYRLAAYFPEATGLEVGMQVTQAGYVVGLVERVTPLFPGRDDDARHCPASAPLADTALPIGAGAPAQVTPCFRARLRIRNDWPVPSDSRIQLGAAGLLKGEVLKIQPGATRRLLADGDQIGTLAREMDLLARLADLSSTIDTLVADTIAPALQSLASQIRTIEELLGTGEDQDGNRDRLAGALESLRTLAAELEQAVDPETIVKTLGAARLMSENLAALSGELGGRTRAIETTVSAYGDLAAEIQHLVRESRPAVQGSLDDTQYLLQSLAAALTPILANIEETSRQLAGLARELRADPSAVLKDRETADPTPWFPR